MQKLVCIPSSDQDSLQTLRTRIAHKLREFYYDLICPTLFLFDKNISHSRKFPVNCRTFAIFCLKLIDIGLFDKWYQTFTTFLYQYCVCCRKYFNRYLMIVVTLSIVVIIINIIVTFKEKYTCICKYILRFNVYVIIFKKTLEATILLWSRFMQLDWILVFLKFIFLRI